MCEFIHEHEDLGPSQNIHEVLNTTNLNATQLVHEHKTRPVNKTLKAIFSRTTMVKEQLVRTKMLTPQHWRIAKPRLLGGEEAAGVVSGITRYTTNMTK